LLLSQLFTSFLQSFIWPLLQLFASLVQRFIHFFIRATDFLFVDNFLGRFVDAMHYNTYVLALAAALSLASAATTQCGQWDSITTGGYILYQDLWNIASGTGSQCSTLNSVSGSTIGWSTSWSWSGRSNQVKSYVNAVVQFTSAPLSQIGSIPTTWSYR
jgi:hypothetical protein